MKPNHTIIIFGISYILSDIKAHAIRECYLFEIFLVCQGILYN